MTDKSINPKKQTVTGVFGSYSDGSGADSVVVQCDADGHPCLIANNGYDSGVNPQGSTERDYL